MTTKKNGSNKARTEPKAGSGSGRLRAVRAGAHVGYVSSSTLADEVLDRTSNPVTAWQILNFIAMWGVYFEVKGHEPPSLRELSEVVAQSHTTLARWSLKFKRAFPEYESPAMLWAKVRDQLAEQGGPVDVPESVAMRIGAAAL